MVTVEAVSLWTREVALNGRWKLWRCGEGRLQLVTTVEHLGAVGPLQNRLGTGRVRRWSCCSFTCFLSCYTDLGAFQQVPDKELSSNLCTYLDLSSARLKFN